MSNEREDIEMNIKKLRELKKNKKGFTLIEIIVVIVILAVLMAVAVPSVLKYLNSADNAKYMAQSRSAMNAMQIELVNAYTADQKLTQAEIAQAFTNTRTELAKDNVDITSIVLYQGEIGAVVDTNGTITTTGTPVPTVDDLTTMPNITAYKVVFGTPAKQALVVVNGSVYVGDTVTVTTAP